MGKWIAVRVSAVLAIAGGGLAAVWAGVLIFAGLATRRAEAVGAPVPFRALMVVVAAFLAGLSVWGMAAGIGVLRRREWARLSMLVLSVLLVGMGGSALVAVIFIRIPADAALTPTMAMWIRAAAAGLYGLLAIIGVVWLALFTSARTQAYFRQGGNYRLAAVDKRPLSIRLIGWFLILATVGAAAAATLRVPMMFFGVLITGWAALAGYTAFAAIQLYLGSGLLQWEEPARIGSIVYFAVAGANAAMMFMLPSMDQRIGAMANALPRFLHWYDGPAASVPSAVWLTGALLMGLPIWFLVRRRSAFQRA